MTGREGKQIRSKRVGTERTWRKASSAAARWQMGSVVQDEVRGVPKADH